MADKDRLNELYRAVQDDNQDLVQSLIKSGVDVNIIDPGPAVNPLDRRRWSPLYQAVRDDNKNMAQILIQGGADGNTADTGIGFTALKQAIENDNKDIVQLLIEAGADVNLGDSFNKFTPLHQAVVYESKDIVQLLVEAGADANISDIIYARGSNPLYEAVRNDNIQFVQLLIKAGADVNLTSQRLTPLFQAMRNDNKEIVKTLIDSRADLNIGDRGDCSPLADAVRYYKNVERKALDQNVAILYVHGAYDGQVFEMLDYHLNHVDYESKWLPELLQLIRLSGNRDQGYRQVLQPLVQSLSRQIYRDQVQDCIHHVLSLKESSRVLIRRQLRQVGDGTSIWKRIDHLELPTQLMDYLKMLEFLLPDDESDKSNKGGRSRGRGHCRGHGRGCGRSHGRGCGRGCRRGGGGCGRGR